MNVAHGFIALVAVALVLCFIALLYAFCDTYPRAARNVAIVIVVISIFLMGA